MEETNLFIIQMIYDCLHRIPERLGRKIIRSITKFNKFSGYLENKKITGFVYNCSKYLKCILKIIAILQ